MLYQRQGRKLSEKYLTIVHVLIHYRHARKLHPVPRECPEVEQWRSPCSAQERESSVVPGEDSTGSQRCLAGRMEGKKLIDDISMEQTI